MLQVILIVATVLCLCITAIKKVNASSKEDGTLKQPRGASLFALLMLWKGDLFHFYQELQVNYRPVLQVRVFGNRTIIINDKKLARVCFANVHCCGSMALPFFKKLGNVRGSVTASAGEGIAIAPPDAAGHLRKFFMKQFAERGRRSGTWQTQQELQMLSLIRELESKDGQPFLLSKFFAPFTSSAVWATLSNEPLKPNVFQAHIKAMKAISDFSTMLGMICVWLPELTAKISSSCRKRFDEYREAAHLAKLEVDMHLSRRIPNEPTNIIDVYQDKVEATTDRHSSFHASKNSIYSVMQDIIMGGIDTTSTSLDWLLLYMTLNPRIQENLQKEVDCYVGTNRLPNVHDRSNMPYTEACVLEILRLQPIFPLSIPREVTCDTEVDGHFFQKGAVILTNIAAINRDPEAWDDPAIFRPERFLCPETGQILAEKRSLINTFGTGLRSCPGQQIAQETLFVFAAAIFQRFNVFSTGELETTPSIGLMSAPKENLVLKFEPRGDLMLKP